MTAAQHFSVTPPAEQDWRYVCDERDLVTNSGVCALIDSQQVAIFKLVINGDVHLYALSNFDPIGQANVLCRGVIGSIAGEPVVASPLYKEHYFLATGACHERNDVAVTPYSVKQHEGQVYIALSQSA